MAFSTGPRRLERLVHRAVAQLERCRRGRRAGRRRRGRRAARSGRRAGAGRRRRCGPRDGGLRSRGCARGVQATVPGRGRPALDGILVADLSRVLAGPAVHDEPRRPRRRRDQGRAPRRRRRHARLGAALRATRARPTTWASTATSARSRSTSRTPADLALARELCVRADVVVESFRPGTSDRLGPRLRRGRAGQPGRRVLLDQRLRLGRARRRAARLRPAAAGHERAHVGHRRARRAAAEGRRGAHRHDLRPLRHQRHPRRPARPRPRRPRPARRGLAHGLARWPRLLNQASAHLNAGVGARAHGQPPPVDRPLRDVRGRRRRLRGRRRQRHDLRAGCARSSAAPELAGDERFATNAARMEHRDALAAELEAAFATRAGRRLGRPARRGRACRPGRSTTSRRPSPSPPSSASSPSTRRTACAPCARRCASARRRRL